MVSSPITIGDWKAAQTTGDGLANLLALAKQERQLASVAWISLASDKQLKKQWEHLQTLPCDLPLWGVPFAVKDNIDVATFTTTAACPGYSSTPASSSAPVIQNLAAAGAIVLGKTNLDQFATGLVGTRSPYGAVPNAFDPARVSGGSSSGSSVVVARGVVPFSLGTDTAGSGRVPAGLNNIVGLKPTRGALSARGVVPACRTLDCVSIFAQTVADAETVLTAAEGFDKADAYSRIRPSSVALPTLSKNTPPTVAVCASPPWFEEAGDQEHAYLAALEKARSLGWNLVSVDFAPLFALAQLLYEGPWVAERYQAICGFIEANEAAGEESYMDPTVHSIILKARTFTAADCFASEYKRQELTREIEQAFAAYDFLLVPTCPIFPTLKQVAAEPVLENSRLGTYTNFVNFLDWSALSVPAGFRADGLPFGVTLIARTWQDYFLCRFGQCWLSGEPRLLGATGTSRAEPCRHKGNMPSAKDTVEVVVVGAHLSGLPLNSDLTNRGAHFVEATKTAAAYRLYALALSPGSTIRKPGLRRVVSTAKEAGASIAVEVWALPTNQLASFMVTIPHPLGLGSVELVGGSWKIGFICEPAGLHGAKDVTAFGGWRSYMASISTTVPSSAPAPKTIRKVLIANRGEIAVRIIRTLHAMGLEAIAIYSPADASALHVRNADIALALTGDTVAATYLNGDRILALAKSVGADAVIPGYGFLAENADFAVAVESAGLVWIGPTPEQMRQLGLKHTARAIAVAAGVPVVPGSDALLGTADEAVEVAEHIGFPVMLKSTAGGGGIGLKQCDDVDSLRDAFAGVQRLAEANFGDGGVFVERFVALARHIEVQIIGDGEGKVWAAGERDCSLQRRHQKLVEESPAPGLPAPVAQRMRKAAMDLTSSVKYRGVGTVEFIYDVGSKEFYFLEVNTRLQVEHPVTESVTGLDLVEVMVRVAQGDFESVASKADADRCFPAEGASIEVRLYAESPLQEFRPCAGRILHVQFPQGVRVDTWVEKGTELTPFYDPLVAKLVSFGRDRAEAARKLDAALCETELIGVETNREYLAALLSSDPFITGSYSTSTLDTAFSYSDPSAISVLESGPATTVQDYPGRTGLWHAGIPPSGPMDSYSFRLANRAVGNAPDAPALEATLQGPTLQFHTDSVFAITGAAVDARLDAEAIPMNKPVTVKSGQVLRTGTITSQKGNRVYIAVRGGFHEPRIFGSCSTFEVGQLGGHNGRKLQNHDILHIGDYSSTAALECVPSTPIPTSSQAWNISVVPGPHGAPDLFTSQGLVALFTEPWTVHYNSNRLGIRLTGPKPKWARKDGGEGGLHPSNIHDAPYSVGSVSFTGDEAIVLTCDGPSLGGFVVFCVVATAEQWKLGQLRPGDVIQFCPVTAEQAIEAQKYLDLSVETLRPLQEVWWEDEPDEEISELATYPEPDPSGVLGSIGSNGRVITARQAGDCAILLEFGENNVFALSESLAIYSFIEQHMAKTPIPGVVELTPGVRTIHVQYEQGTAPATMLAALAAHSYDSTSRKVPSRRVSLPIAFRDSACAKAVKRYASTIRGEAPWLPDNTEFLEELNGLEAGGVEAIIGGAEFLVLGLGDVFLGSPCAVPLDPRHRLFGTKYNPSRNFTPRYAVGIGGQYMCIYGGESPGGYQLVGRTLPVWQEQKVEYVTRSKGATAKLDKDTRPWVLQLFDRVSFYPVTEEELERMENLPGGSGQQIIEEDAMLDVAEYEAWLASIQDEVTAVAAQRHKAISNYPRLDELVAPAPKPPAQEKITGSRGSKIGLADVPAGLQAVQAGIPGRCFKCVVNPGDTVNAGDAVLWLESNKMEIQISSSVAGTVESIQVEVGELVSPVDILVVISPNKEA